MRLLSQGHHLVRLATQIGHIHGDGLLGPGELHGEDLGVGRGVGLTLRVLVGVEGGGGGRGKAWDDRYISLQQIEDYCLHKLGRN